MKHLFAGLAVLAACLTITASATASRPQANWTQEQAENAVLDSDWADTWGIDDALCAGRGKSARTPAGSRTYGHFVCQFSRDFDGPWEQTGQLTVLRNGRWSMLLVSSYGDGQTLLGYEPDNVAPAP